MVRRGLLAILAVFAGCDDDDPEVCESVVETGVLPTEGDYIHPDELTLPEECVVGGLANVPGRWFVRDPTKRFGFDYPRIEGSCTNGYRRSGAADDYSFEDDGRTRHTWSDGTRLFFRSEQRAPTPDGTIYSSISASAMCMLPDGTLAAVLVSGTRFGESNQFAISSAIGTRFAHKDALARGLELVGELATTASGQPGVALNLVVEGAIAYVAASTGLHVVDVSDPAMPVEIGHHEGYFNDVKVVHAADQTYAILAGNGQRTQIVDVTMPSEPNLVQIIDNYSHSLFVQQQDARVELYLSDYESAIPIYDVTNPLAPTRIGAARVPSEQMAGVHDLFVDGTQIFANYTTGGFVAFDVATSLSSPLLLGSLPTSYSHASWRGVAGGRPVLLHGDEGMTGTGDGGAFMRVLDGDPASPTFMQELGRYQSRPEVGIHNIELHGDLAYIAYYQDGVRIVDLADPTAPREVAHYNTWDPLTAYGGPFEGAIGIRVVDGLIYVADSERGLLILRRN